MATSAEVQAASDTENTMFKWRIQNTNLIGTDTNYYVVGITPPFMGKAGWITTATAGNAATQAAAIDAALPLL